MKAFLAAVIVALAIAAVAGVLLSTSQQSSREAFQSTSGTTRLTP